MSQPELLKYIIELLDANGIPYMVTGSVASSMQGEPRSTHDIDVVIILQLRFANAFAEVFPKEQFYINTESIVEAIQRSSMFNLIDQFSGNKVDFWMLTNEEYDQTRFARRQSVRLLGIDKMCVTCPEDTIISKLKWAKIAGGSQKQLMDSTRVYETQYAKLDIAYIMFWIKKLELEKEWEVLLNQADPIG